MSKKEEFKKNLMEQQLFNELKDIPFRNSEYIFKKYQGLDINHSRLYRRIVNYQIKTYGEQLCNARYVKRLDK
ncbi:MAG: hypothetical protein IJH55_05365, partial [Romboutsia sp.]|nr:hypothetical protein [Romboutsia sp.]